MKQTILFTLLITIVIACGSRETKSSETTPKPEVSSVDGAKVFKQSCVVCHGSDGKLGVNGAKDITVSELSLEERMALVSKGKGLMTPFENILSLTEIKAVAEYTLTLK